MSDLFNKLVLRRKGTVLQKGLLLYPRKEGEHFLAPQLCQPQPWKQEQRSSWAVYHGVAGSVFIENEQRNLHLTSSWRHWKGLCVSEDGL